ncbi:MAG: hypothetical protein M9935_05945 [Kiritimatiellae bacterium]|nr:hypothetical protein [Kiritimatiellia bacterium]
MKKMLRMYAALGFLLASTSWADAPHGGRILESDGIRAEFFVNEAREVELRFLGDEHEVESVGERRASAIVVHASERTELSFEAKGDALVSTAALPDGDGYTIVVRIATREGEKPRNFRIAYHAEACDECNRPEYACICEHSEHGGH